jgi:TusA-related sulfurtransferase
MKDAIDVRLACCVVNRKVLIKHIDQMACHDELRLISEDNDSMKTQIRKLAEKYNCRIFNVDDRDDVSYITIMKNE